MYDKGIVRGAPLGGIDSLCGLTLRGVGPKTVYRFGREDHKTAVPQDLTGAAKRAAILRGEEIGQSDNFCCHSD